MKLKVINNADDFGYSNAINYGIIDAHREGILNSATMMSHMDGFIHATTLARQNPNLAIGVHCTLTCGRPIIKTHKTLLEVNGNFKKLPFYEIESNIVDLDEVYREFKAQIERIISFGIKPTHLDSHHHIHRYKNLSEVMMSLATEYKLPVRNTKTVELKATGVFVNYTTQVAEEGMRVFLERGIKTNSLLIEPYLRKGSILNRHGDLEEAIVDEIIDALETAKGNLTVEIMWHPAYVDKKIMENSSFNIPRIYETRALMNPRLIKYFQENCIICNFTEL